MSPILSRNRVHSRESLTGKTPTLVFGWVLGRPFVQTAAGFGGGRVSRSVQGMVGGCCRALWGPGHDILQAHSEIRDHAVRLASLRGALI